MSVTQVNYQIEQRSTYSLIRGAGGCVVAANSCPSCRGSLLCVRCAGQNNKCRACGGTGKCSTCIKHVEALSAYVLHFVIGDLDQAEANLTVAFGALSDYQTNSKAALLIGGMIIGAILGSAVAPGTGTIIGLIAGKTLAEAKGESAAKTLHPWRLADLLFALGMLYYAQGKHEEARQAFKQSLQYTISFEPSKMMLAEMSKNGH